METDLLDIQLSIFSGDVDWVTVHNKIVLAETISPQRCLSERVGT